MWAPAPDCSGHGQLQPGGLCLCDDAWSAGSDLFQLRVNGPFALDCVTPNAAVYVMWALFLAMALLKQKESGGALAHKCKSLSAVRRSLLTSQLTRLLVLDFTLATPLLMVAAVLKLANPRTAVLGSDVPFTLTLSFGVLCTASLWSAFQVMQFGALIVANFYHHNGKIHGVLNVDKITQILLALSYGLLTVLPTLCAFALDQTLGPWASGEWVIIVVRNIGVVVWQLCGLSGNILLIRQVKRLNMTASMDAPNNSSKLENDKTSAAQRVVAYLTASAKTMLKTNLAILVLYSLFSIPFSWPFQTFSVCIAIIVMVRSYSMGKIVMATRQAAHLAMSPGLAEGGGGGGQVEVRSSSLMSGGAEPDSFTAAATTRAVVP
jgi:hypothetical protein